MDSFVDFFDRSFGCCWMDDRSIHKRNSIAKRVESQIGTKRSSFLNGYDCHWIGLFDTSTTSVGPEAIDQLHWIDITITTIPVVIESSI